MKDTPRLSWTDVRDIMRARILARRYPLGARLPRDEDIAQDLGCARTTVHRAMQDLAAAGLIERRRKGGSHVKADPITRATLDIPNMRAEVQAQGRAYGYRLIAREMAPCPAPIAAQLGLPAPQPILHVTALHLADTKPYIFEDRWINPAAVPEILAVDLAKVSANEWLVANKPYSRLEISLYAVNAGADIAHHMACPQGTALLVNARATWTQGDPITYVQSYAAAGYQLAARGFSQ
jgi:GntR family transcriptional regulator, histidine utilization repressor